MTEAYSVPDVMHRYSSQDTPLFRAAQENFCGVAFARGVGKYVPEGVEVGVREGWIEEVQQQVSEHLEPDVARRTAVIIGVKPKSHIKWVDNRLSLGGSYRASKAPLEDDSPSHTVNLYVDPSEWRYDYETLVHEVSHLKDTEKLGLNKNWAYYRLAMLPGALTVVGAGVTTTAAVNSQLPQSEALNFMVSSLGAGATLLAALVTGYVTNHYEIRARRYSRSALEGVDD